MDWLKDLSPAALIAACLLYIVRYLGNHMTQVTNTLNRLSSAVDRMDARVNDCPERGRRDD